MAKQVGDDDTDLRDSRSIIGITKGRLKQLMAKLRSNSASAKEIGEDRRELINIAVDKDHLHPGALSVIVRLDKQEAVKRNEWLYHFDLMRGHMGWDESDLLPDREPLHSVGVEEAAQASA